MAVHKTISPAIFGSEFPSKGAMFSYFNKPVSRFIQLDFFLFINLPVSHLILQLYPTLYISRITKARGPANPGPKKPVSASSTPMKKLPIPLKTPQTSECTAHVRFLSYSSLIFAYSANRCLILSSCN